MWDPEHFVLPLWRHGNVKQGSPQDYGSTCKAQVDWGRVTINELEGPCLDPMSFLAFMSFSVQSRLWRGNQQYVNQSDRKRLTWRKQKQKSLMQNAAGNLESGKEVNVDSETISFLVNVWPLQLPAARRPYSIRWVYIIAPQSHSRKYAFLCHRTPLAKQWLEGNEIRNI